MMAVLPLTGACGGIATRSLEEAPPVETTTDAGPPVTESEEWDAALLREDGGGAEDGAATPEDGGGGAGPVDALWITPDAVAPPLDLGVPAEPAPGGPPALDAGAADAGPDPMAPPPLLTVDAGTGPDAEPALSDAAPAEDAGAEADAIPDAHAAADTGAPTPGFDDGSDPCPPAGTPCRIMPLGDSITVGLGSPGAGYRPHLFRLLSRANKEFTFVGSQANGPMVVDGKPFPRDYEAYSGYAIDTGGGARGIYPLVTDALIAHKPHIVLLMIGTNDVNRQIDLPNAPRRLGLLLERIHVVAPQTMVVLATIPPFRSDAGTARVRPYNDAMPAVVAERVARGQRLRLIDVFGPYVANPEYRTALLADELHPNKAGYDKLAELWLPALLDVLR
jgi:lysophospholipase L1-like esterase